MLLGTNSVDTCSDEVEKTCRDDDKVPGDPVLALLEFEDNMGDLATSADVDR